MSITAQRIKQLRKIYGLTQKDLADKINSSRTNVARIETDKVHPSYPMLSTIANVFDVPIEYLQGIVNADIDNNHENVLYFYDDGEQLNPNTSFYAHNEKELHELYDDIDETVTKLLLPNGDVFIEGITADELRSLDKYATFLKWQRNNSDTSHN